MARSFSTLLIADRALARNLPAGGEVPPGEAAAGLDDRLRAAPAMGVSAPAFRDALRHFPAGVTLVTIRSGDVRHGLTVSAFASISPEPPLVAIVIDHRHRAHELLERPDATFAVSVLAAEQRALADRFAWESEEDRLAVGRWSVAATGAPVLEDALAWLDCRIAARHPTGSHSIYVGEVVASSVPRPGEAPLVYWNRDYRRLEPA